jgi:hypothetical protein
MADANAVDRLHQDPQDVDRAVRVLRAMEVAEPYQRKWRDRADHFYNLYRSYRSYRSEAEANPRGQDRVDLFRNAQDSFGKELFIPFCFSVVETVVPSLLANRPQMEVGPRPMIPAHLAEASAKNAESMKAMLTAQQEAINYELKLQTIAKDGLIYGLGVGKTFWKQDYRKRRSLIPNPLPVSERQIAAEQANDPRLLEDLIPGERELQMVFDDPDVLAVDPFDFFYDPFAEEIDDAEFAIHRTWRSNRYIARMVEAGKWKNLEDVDNIDALAEGQKWQEAFQNRLSAGGLHSPPGASTDGAKADKHEVLEFHDGEQVITLLDRKLVVQAGENPHWHGEMPFQVYRPTQVPHQIPGIGEIEPIEGLQEEMNVLRTQRRWNAQLVLQKVFAYNDGLIEPSDLVFGPGMAIPVNGDPRELLMGIDVGDIPHSGYMEEDRISADIDRTTGISDVISGGGGGSDQTATAAQMGYQAASARIENKTKRIKLEVVEPQASQFGMLNQQMIRSPRTLAQKAPAQAGEVGPEAERRYTWFEIDPSQLRGEFAYTVVERSMEADNVPQDRQDAQALLGLLSDNPNIEQRQLIVVALKKLGISQADQLLAPPEPKIPPEFPNAVVDNLIQMGMPPEQAEQLVMVSLTQSGGPDMGAGQENPMGMGANPPESAAGPPEATTEAPALAAAAASPNGTGGEQ